MNIKKHIPNTITCCNLISGCIATVCALYVQTELALLWIIIGAVFDFFDGMSARWLSVSSPIGKELDSLADVVTFGVAPSAMVFAFLSAHVPPSVPAFLALLAFVMAAFSALRLAKFNLDERQTTSFIGLPTPANALFWGSLFVGYGDWLSQTPYAFWIVLVLVLVFSCLLVAELPLFALKFKHWGLKGNEVKYLFLLTSLLLLLMGVRGLPIVIVWYVVLSVVARKQC